MHKASREKVVIRIQVETQFGSPGGTEPVEFLQSPEQQLEVHITVVYNTQQWSNWYIFYRLF